MDIQIKAPGAELRENIEKLRRAPAGIRKALNKEIRSSTAPIEKQAKANVLAIESKGVAGGGRVQRGGFRASMSRRALYKGQVSTFKAHTGLRANIAKGVTRKITYSGFRTGVRIRADGKYLPESQRVLIGKTNSGKNFRHPVMGSDNWVNQKFSPAEWFDRAVREKGPEAVARIDAAASAAVRQLLQ